MLDRYTVVVLNGKKNPLIEAVAKDVSNALLKTRASGGNLAEYRDKYEAEAMLQMVFEKYSKIGGVWTAAAAKVSSMRHELDWIGLTYHGPHQVHADQLAHVKKGCLERRRQDIAADGSRIEGSHKAWNTLQRAHASGLEMFTALSRDFVHRRNIRIVSTTGRHRGPSTGFVSTTHGSHHTRLQNAINVVFNSLAERELSWGGNLFPLRPVLQQIDSGEAFGLVVSDHSLTFGGLWQIKDEPDENQQLVDLITDPNEELDAAFVLRGIDIDPALLNQPQARVEPVPSGVPHLPLDPQLLALVLSRSSHASSSAVLQQCQSNTSASDIQVRSMGAVTTAGGLGGGKSEVPMVVDSKEQIQAVTIVSDLLEH